LVFWLNPVNRNETILVAKARGPAIPGTSPRTN